MNAPSSTENTAEGADAGRSAEAEAVARDARSAAPFGPTLALVLTISVGAFFLVAPLAGWVLPTTDVPAPFQDHHQDAETALFALAFVVLLPLAAVFVPRLADRLAAATGETSFSTLAALAAAGLVVAAATIRAAGSSGLAIVVAMVVWGCPNTAAGCQIDPQGGPIDRHGLDQCAS